MGDRARMHRRRKPVEHPASKSSRFESEFRIFQRLTLTHHCCSFALRRFPCFNLFATAL